MQNDNNLKKIYENMGKYGKIWENMGKYGKIWEKYGKKRKHKKKIESFDIFLINYLLQK